MPKQKLPALPILLARKIYKTGQTRGADDDEIYQNRVSRNGTVLIPFSTWELCRPNANRNYENGFIVLISPDDYFSPNFDERLRALDLNLGRNALVFFETRSQWMAHPVSQLGWRAATRRISAGRSGLGGQFVARVPATTAVENGAKIAEGFTGTGMKGAGIRVYEYASDARIEECRVQLEALFWLCRDSGEVASANGLNNSQSTARKEGIIRNAEERGLLDFSRLRSARIISADRRTICPLCLEELSAEGFFARMAQAEGREVHDLTVTVLNLFHIAELRYGEFNHRPYNLGWGHHHCNVVVKDAGILSTLEWMLTVVMKNIENEHLPIDEQTLHWMQGVIQRNVKQGQLPANANSGRLSS